VSAFGLLFGIDRLIVGVERDRGGWVRVYLDARWKHRYVLLQPGPEAERVVAQWSNPMHHYTADVPRNALVFEGDPILGLA
jgi:hypothetical protein